ncbi:MAG TPA: metal-sulfur cluster assembly factor [Gammaproteobacteria bacterium]|jgi:metal-sulfur cluster biosynthetic enzyme|nr:metal-sulfur cluster assembly factor [Gammaproteobacteria bacterium]
MKLVRSLFGRQPASAEPAPESPPAPAVAEPEPVAGTGAAAPSGEPPTPEAVLDAMHDVIDPELGYNIVDIGLIYELYVRERNVVEVIMTMTTPGCPAQDYIMRGVYERGMRIDGVSDVKVELIWHPPWTPQMMTPRAKAHFRIPEQPQ